MPAANTSTVSALVRLALENRHGIVWAFSYLVRRAKAAARFARVSTPTGEVYAMYVRSRDQTWACFVADDEELVSTRLVVCEGCVLSRIADIALAPDEFPLAINLPVETGVTMATAPVKRTNSAFIRTFAKYVPAAAVEAAVAMDAGDAHFRRWRKPGSEDLHRVDAIYACAVDQTWALVNEGGATRLEVIRGHHLDRLDQIYENRLATKPAFVVTDV